MQDLIEKTTDEANWSNGDMAINFASAWDGNAKKYSDPINNYLRGLDSTGFVGVIMHDFIDAELAENVYLRNDQLFHGTSANEFIGGGYGDDKIFGGKGRQINQVALALESLHNFSLIHDDVMDNAEIRRGKSSVKKKWNQNTYMEKYKP